MPDEPMPRSVSILVAILIPLAGSAQLVDDFNPPRSNCCLAGAAQTLANQLLDWNQLGRYHADNKKLSRNRIRNGWFSWGIRSLTGGNWRIIFRTSPM